MACPACGCKVSYQYDEEEFGSGDERMERCAACGEVFDIEDSAEEEEDGAYMRHAPNDTCECHDCHVARRVRV